PIPRTLHPCPTRRSSDLNIVTKAGTNAYHGDAFGFVRNKVFNARDFFATDRDPLKRSQWGGTIGGPLRRDKLFAFFGYQGTRVRSETFGMGSFVLAVANLHGDMSPMFSAS